ncbi:hypothetical protein HZA55_09945 [Candidatus Poribacteria bacterium]|nr:hypothetical protein [Candidatus Poribacteria bacterium]
MVDKESLKISYQKILHFIKRFRFYQKAVVFIEGLCLQLSVLVISVLCYVSIDNFLFDYKKYFLGVFILVNLLTFIFVIFHTWASAKDIKKLAVYLEAQIPLKHNQLVSSLEFYEDYDLYTNVYGYLSEFIKLLLNQTYKDIENINPIKALDLRELRKKYYSTSVFISFFLLWMIFFPDLLVKTFNNYNQFEHKEYFKDRTIIRIFPQEMRVNKNANATINLFFYGKVPEEATIYTGVKSDDFYIFEKIDVPKAGVKEFTFKNIQRDTYFYVTSSNAHSQTGMIAISRAPIISDITLTYNYPAYTELKTNVFKNTSGNIKTLPGTRVKIEAYADKSLSGAEIVFDSANKINMEIADSTKISATILVSKQGTYFFSLTSMLGEKNVNPVKYNIELEKDLSPGVDVVLPGKDANIPIDLKPNIIITGEDDFGIKKLRLKYIIVGKSDEKAIDLVKFNPAKTSVKYEYVWDMNEENLSPGYVIQYYVEAWDNDTVSGPKCGTSPVYHFKFPSLYEIYQETEMEHGKQIDELSNIQNESKELKSRMEEARKNMEQENKIDWNKENEIKQINDKHKDLMDKMKNTSKEFEKATQEMAKNSLVQESLIEKVMEIRKLMQDIMTEEMKAVLQKLTETMKDVNIDEKKKQLLDAEFNQEKFMQKLDRTIELLKNVRNERRLDVLSEEAKRLAERQNEIAKELEKISKKDKSDINKAEINNLQIKQEQIRNETSKLQEDIANLAQDFNKKNPDISKKLENIADKLNKSQITDKMKSMEQAMKNENINIPSQEAQKASSQLGDTANQLNKIKQEMKRNLDKEILSMIQAIIYNGLYISHEQEKILLGLQDRSRKTKSLSLAEENFLDDYAVKEMQLSEGIHNTANVLIAIAKMSPMVDTKLIVQLEELSNRMASFKTAIGENDLFSVIPGIEETLVRLNMIINEFFKTSDMMKKKMAQSQSQDMMDQLSDMTQKQQTINDLTESLQKQFEEQGQLTPSEQEALEKMTYEQNKLKEMMDQLAEQYSKMDNMMGKLDDVKDLMEESAKALKEKMLNADLNKKQKRIINRLLDAQKSLQNKEEQDKERQAEKAKSYESPKSPDELSKELTALQKKELKNKLDIQLETIPLEYRELTEKYFKSLSEIVW